jgi:hypothetical protein
MRWNGFEVGECSLVSGIWSRSLTILVPLQLFRFYFHGSGA